jgi:hypothetical protein
MSEEIKLSYSNIQDEKMLAKLGDIVTLWAFAEAVIEDIIAGLLGTDVMYAYVVTANVNISTRLKAATALAHMRFDQSLYAEFASLIEQMTVLAPFRNKLVHGLWSEIPKEDGPGVARVAAIRAGNRLKRQNEYVNLEYLIWLANQIERIATLLFGFGKRHGLIESPNIARKISRTITSSRYGIGPEIFASL